MNAIPPSVLARFVTTFLGPVTPDRLDRFNTITADDRTAMFKSTPAYLQSVSDICRIDVFILTTYALEVARDVASRASAERAEMTKRWHWRLGSGEARSGCFLQNNMRICAAHAKTAYSGTARNLLRFPFFGFPR